MGCKSTKISSAVGPMSPPQGRDMMEGSPVPLRKSPYLISGQELRPKHLLRMKNLQRRAPEPRSSATGAREGESSPVGGRRADLCTSSSEVSTTADSLHALHATSASSQVHSGRAPRGLHCWGEPSNLLTMQNNPQQHPTLQEGKSPVTFVTVERGLEEEDDDEGDDYSGMENDYIDDDGEKGERNDAPGGRYDGGRSKSLVGPTGRHSGSSSISSSHEEGDALEGPSVPEPEPLRSPGVVIQSLHLQTQYSAPDFVHSRGPSWDRRSVEKQNTNPELQERRATQSLYYPLQVLNSLPGVYPTLVRSQIHHPRTSVQPINSQSSSQLARSSSQLPPYTGHPHPFSADPMDDEMELQKRVAQEASWNVQAGDHSGGVQETLQDELRQQYQNRGQPSSSQGSAFVRLDAVKEERVDPGSASTEEPFPITRGNSVLGRRRWLLDGPGDRTSPGADVAQTGEGQSSPNTAAIMGPRSASSPTVSTSKPMGGVDSTAAQQRLSLPCILSPDTVRERKSLLQRGPLPQKGSPARRLLRFQEDESSSASLPPLEEGTVICEEEETTVDRVVRTTATMTSSSSPPSQPSRTISSSSGAGDSVLNKSLRGGRGFLDDRYRPHDGGRSRESSPSFWGSTPSPALAEAGSSTVSPLLPTDVVASALPPHLGSPVRERSLSPSSRRQPLSPVTSSPSHSTRRSSVGPESPPPASFIPVQVTPPSEAGPRQFFSIPSSPVLSPSLVGGLSPQRTTTQRFSPLAGGTNSPTLPSAPQPGGAEGPSDVQEGRMFRILSEVSLRRTLEEQRAHMIAGLAQLSPHLRQKVHEQLTEFQSRIISELAQQQSSSSSSQNATLIPVDSSSSSSDCGSERLPSCSAPTHGGYHSNASSHLEQQRQQLQKERQQVLQQSNASPPPPPPPTTTHQQQHSAQQVLPPQSPSMWSTRVVQPLSQQGHQAASRSTSSAQRVRRFSLSPRLEGGSMQQNRLQYLSPGSASPQSKQQLPSFQQLLLLQQQQQQQQTFDQGSSHDVFMQHGPLWSATTPRRNSASPSLFLAGPRDCCGVFSQHLSPLITSGVSTSSQPTPVHGLGSPSAAASQPPHAGSRVVSGTRASMGAVVPPIPIGVATLEKMTGRPRSNSGASSNPLSLSPSALAAAHADSVLRGDAPPQQQPLLQSQCTSPGSPGVLTGERSQRSGGSASSRSITFQDTVYVKPFNSLEKPSSVRRSREKLQTLREDGGSPMGKPHHGGSPKSKK